MGSKERRERQKAERREFILDAANEIVGQEGIEGLSMRKIADKIEYSPTLIYHYFNNKEEIIEALMERGFQKIIGGLQGSVLTDDEPDNQFRWFMRQYIDNALENPEEYRTVLLSTSPAILKYTAVLYQGASVKPSVGVIERFLRGTYFKNCEDVHLVEEAVQIIWASMLGLIIRMIIEMTPEDQRTRLVYREIEMMLGAIKWMSAKTEEERL